MAETKPERSAADPHGADRRRTIKGLMVASIAAPMVLTPRKSRAATIKITVRDPGGPYVKAMNEAFYKPFNDAMKGDIVVTGVISAHEPTAMIKSMVESKTYTWDIAGGFSISSTKALLEGPGYLEKLNIDDDPEVQEIPTRFRMPYMLGYEVFTCVMAYRTDVFPKKAPAPVNGWKDLWDVARIPGIRSLRKNPFYTIEQAVMADGVPGNQVYEHLRKNGFDPAFKSLDKIKKNVNIWWTGAAQTSQLLATGEVDLVPTFNGRAQDAIDGGAPVALSWNQALWTYGGMAIIKGGPNVEACRKFVKFCANAERQATLAKHIAVGPTNPKAFKHIPPARAAVLGTDPGNFAKSIEFDADFWGKEKDRGTDRFNQWILG
jgi:putative spermidine/putrescine transport system substrate-binding protein